MTFAEFEQKYKNFDVMTASFEDELSYRQDQFDMFETEGFTDTFQTPYEECSEYNGQKYELVRRASYVKGDCDMECLPQCVCLKRHNNFGPRPSRYLFNQLKIISNLILIYNIIW